MKRFMIVKFGGIYGQYGPNIFNITAIFFHEKETIEIRLTQYQFNALKKCKIGEPVIINRP